MSSVNDQQTFWKIVHAALPKPKTVRNEITVDQWYRKLLEHDTVVNEDVQENTNELNHDNYF